MSRIFLSHSSNDSAPAIALRDWLVDEGWNEYFLDLDPERGIVAGERWERALNEAARRCEAVLFLISKAWLASRWCINELSLARRLNKRLFGVLIEEGVSVNDLPPDVTSTWQLVNLATGRDHKQFRVTLPITGEETHITYSLEGLARLKIGLQRAGLHASHFEWPPAHDPNRPPYRGLRPLEAEDAGIFFGREAPVVEAVDRLRGLREAAPPRLLVIVGASGAGKSSFLRAGLLPRLARDDATFLPLPVIRPERAVITGETGLLASLEAAFKAAKIQMPRAELRTGIEGGFSKLGFYLETLANRATLPSVDGEVKRKPPALVVAIDQAEELFLVESQEEAGPFLTLMHDLLLAERPDVIVLLTIRSDNYERIQQAHELADIHKVPFDLGPMAKGSYAEVIKGPVRRLEHTSRSLRINDSLVGALLADIESGGGKDALPLLAFTLERLYGEYHAGGYINVAHYEHLGRIKGSIEAAVERAFKAADADARIPKDRQARLTLLRRGLIPWLAGIDPDTSAPRRRVARLSEIPDEARPLIDQLIEQRLLATDVASDTGEKTVEPAHEALLRQWGLLQTWLKEDAGLLTVLDGIKRAARDWSANAKSPSWLTHTADRLRAAERLLTRPDLAANLEPTDNLYISTCREAENRRRANAKRAKALVGILLFATIAIGGLAYVGYLDRSYLTMQSGRIADVLMPTILSSAAENALRPGDRFQECANCPEMVVLPSGNFSMGSNHQGDEQPIRDVTIARAFAVSKFDVTFDDWDACVVRAGCTYKPGDNTWGRNRRPVINVNWDDANTYIGWLVAQTGKPYRLLTEAEWEYAARANSTTVYSFGDNKVQLDEHSWYARNSNSRIQTVGEKKPNAFGLFDMHGNVWQWTVDCYKTDYKGAPTDGSAVDFEGCNIRVLRGGSWNSYEGFLRSTIRNGGYARLRSTVIGFRIGRTLMPKS